MNHSALGEISRYFIAYTFLREIERDKVLYILLFLTEQAPLFANKNLQNSRIYQSIDYNILKT